MNQTQFFEELDSLYAMRNSQLTSFSREVASSIFETLRVALDDHSRHQYCLQVSSAPTGSGKSSSALAFLSCACKVDQIRSALVVETTAQADAAFRELRGLLGDKVAVWTHTHDAANPTVDTEVFAEKGFIPAERFFRDDLTSRPVVIVTHAFFEGKNGHIAASGRHLVVYDEKPKDVTIFDLGHHDFAAFRDGVLFTMGAQSDLYQAAKELWKFVDEIYEKGGVVGTPGVFEPLSRGDPEPFLPLLAALADDPEKLATLICSSLDRERVTNIAGFAKSLAGGYAFLYKYNHKQTEGCRFVGYSMDFPLRAGMALLDATSDIDGVSQLVSWRVAPVPCPQVNYERLMLHPIEPPADIRKTKVDTIIGRTDLVDRWREWVVHLVAKHTMPGESVLIVTHKKLIPHLPRLHQADPLEAHWEGRKVHYCNWGNGIGSNQWRRCEHVFLIGEFFIPRRATVASCLGLTNSRPTGSSLQDAQNIKALKGGYLDHQEGHLLRWTKQLACRGNVRNIDGDGVCGEMHLYVTGEFKRLISHGDRLFPGCQLLPRDTSANPNVVRSATEPFVARLTSCLMKSTADELTTMEVQELAGTRLDGHKLWLTGQEGQQVLQGIGWCFRPGKRGRGNHARFIRLFDIGAFEMEEAA